MKLGKTIITLSMILSLVAVMSCQDNNKKNEAEEVDMNEEPEAQSFEQNQDEMVNTVIVTTEGNPELSTFALRLNAANVQLPEGKAYTIFAPNNNAYSYLYREQGSEVLNVENSTEVYFLIVEGEFTTDALKQQIEQGSGNFVLTTAQGENLIAAMEDKEIILRGPSGVTAKILEENIEASNGVVHIIDGVLLPSDVEKEVILTDIPEDTTAIQ
ncbi:fasciclin domain-containing protein [Salinimicrobium sp. GXAS 041]|uniref:fasciclin domain-containing protein n=1 Tax=Salinimicrobium sp. GXAS 041 TaxID=3400806 RepID=UPI003C739E2E